MLGPMRYTGLDKMAGELDTIFVAIVHDAKRG